MGNEWAVRVVWAGSCGLPLGCPFSLGPMRPLIIFFFSLFKLVCMLNFKFQIYKNMNLFDMISFDLKDH